MGYLLKGTCFPDLATVKSEQCAGASTTWGNTTTQYTAECTAVTASGLTMCRRANGAACTNYTQPFENYQPCAYDGTTSMSLDYFGALLAFLVIVYVGSRIKRIFWGQHEAI